MQWRNGPESLKHSQHDSERGAQPAPGIGGFKISLMPTNLAIEERGQLEEISPIGVKQQEDSMRDIDKKEILVEDVDRSRPMGEEAPVVEEAKELPTVVHPSKKHRRSVAVSDHVLKKEDSWLSPTGLLTDRSNPDIESRNIVGFDKQVSKIVRSFLKLKQFKDGDRERVWKSKRKLYKMIVEMANKFGSLRELVHKFKRERRALLPRGDRPPGEDYFRLCAHYIRVMEEMREDNFMFLRKCFIACAQAMEGENSLLTKQFETMHLSSIARKIDYEKSCNRGLYNIT